MQRDLTEKLRDARKDLSKQDEEDARKARQRVMDEQQERASLTETVFGKNSPQMRQAHEDLARLYAGEAAHAQQLGETAAAYRFARLSLEEYRAAMETLSGAMEEALDVGSAYADYLDAIGQTEQADAFRRQSLSRKQADLAQQYFAEGDAASGYRAAAAAERLARAGMKPERGKRGGFIGGIGNDADVFGGKAVTGALYAPAMQAANRQPIIVQPQTNINLQDGFIDKSKIRVHVNKGNAYEALAQ